MRLEGSAALTVGQGEETQRQEKIEVKKGSKFTVGGIEFEITSAGKSDFVEDPLVVEISASKETERITRMRFVDAGGKEIASNLVSSGLSRSGDSENLTSRRSWAYGFKSELKTFTVEVSLWKHLSTVETPIKLDVSLGF